MRPGRWQWNALAAALLGSQLAAAAGPPSVCLTVDPPAFTLTHEATAGGLLLRELQRQAVGVAARDELGLRTRDAVLGEPASGGAVRVQTRVWRGRRAELRLTGDGVDRPWVGFPISDDPLVDYPAFVARCEAASRGAYRDELRAVVGGPVGRPTAWGDGPADSAAVDWLVHMDVFSQCRAAQLLHAQLRAEGASVERLSALVRAYANLGQLAGNEWSAEPKAYLARSLVYAERLVAHERGSAASRYVRAYARGMAGLTAAAVDDLDAAGRAGGRSPAWAAAVRAYARHDQGAAAAERDAGPWQVRPLAGLLTAFAAADDHPVSDAAAATDAVLSVDPGPVVLMTAGVTSENAYLSHLNEPATDVLAVLARQALLRAPPLPPAAAAAVARVSIAPPDGPPNLAALAQLAEALRRAAADDPTEPSMAALGSLVDQQAFAAVVARTIALRQAGDAAETAKYVAAAAPVLRGHPWGPYVEAMGVDASADPAAVRRAVDRVPADAAGPWAEAAVEQLTVDDATAKVLAERWRRAAHLLSDPVVDDDPAAGADDQARRCCGGDGAEYLRRARRVDPHSANLAAAWMATVGPARAATDDAVYEPTIAQVEAEFADRPTVVGRAADWCQARGQFDRELALLRGIDEVEPTVERCERLARVARRAGHADAAVAYCVRGRRLAGTGATGDEAERVIRLDQLAAAGLIADGRFDAAMGFLRRGDDAADADGLGLMARCAERQGRPDEAEADLRRRAAVSPLTVVSYALWARRLGRPSTRDVSDKAAAAVARPAPGNPQAAPLPTPLHLAPFYLAMADGPPRRALGVLQQLQLSSDDPTEPAQLAAVAATVHEAEMARIGVRLADEAADGGAGFGKAFAVLARSPDPAAGAAAFDLWCDRQLDPERAVDWHGLAGRYLLGTGHVAEGRAELAAVLASGATEREEYFLAWQALRSAGPATRP